MGFFAQTTEGDSMKKRIFLMTLKMAAVAFAFGVLGTNSPAAADDPKLYPGSMCVKWSGPNPTYSWSSIQNPSSSSYLYLDCPAIRDNIGNSINDASITVVDRNYNQDVQCSLNSFYHYSGGFLGWSSPNNYSYGSSNNAQTL
jgi:hypothetical protein